MTKASAIQPGGAVSQETKKTNTNYNLIVKRILSLLSPLYCVFIVFFAYQSVFYQLEVLDETKACMIVTGISVVALAVMLYTRKQFLTKLCSLIMLPVMVFPVMLYFGQWAILLPPLLVSMLIFFLSGIGETAKTVWGTISLLIYLLGALIYFVVNSMFAPSTVTQCIMAGKSPSNTYRYEVYNTTDSSNGSTKVTIEDNRLDKVYYHLFWFKIRGLSHDVVMERPMLEKDKIQIEWKTEKRSDITEQLYKISPNIEVTLTDSQMDMLGREAYQVTFNNGETMSMRQEEYHKTVIALGEKEQEALEVTKTQMNLDKMTEKQKKRLGITVEDCKTVLLSSLTEDDLTKLGIPEEGDVMYYNGKVAFRYYIAILEQYFDISKQDLSIL